MRRVIFLVAVVSLGFPSTARTLEASRQCLITGGGQLNGDMFAGSARSRADFTIEGSLHHLTPNGPRFFGDVQALVCRRDEGDPRHPESGFGIADFTGSGSLDGEHGYSFIARGQDRGEPAASRDRYWIVVSDSDGNVVFASGGILESSNFQIHPTNPGHP